MQPEPESGRVYRARRRVRLSDAAADGRLRLDAVARYLQDVAADDVEDAGWSPDEDVWIVRRTELELVSPLAVDERVELATWCSGVGAAAAARRTTLRGERGGRIEAESVWIHLGRDMRPLRLGERFLGVYGASAGGRGVATRLDLAGPGDGAARTAWPLRRSDVDRLGHVNNAAYWQAVEELLPEDAEPRTAVLEFRAPIDAADPVELLHAVREGTLLVDLVAAGELRARAAVAVGPRGAARAGAPPAPPPGAASPR